MATVIQADREVAAAIRRGMWGAKSDVARAILAGITDDLPIVQQIAAHREASTAKLEADMAAIVAALGDMLEVCDDDNVRSLIYKALTRIQGEYRSGEATGE